MRCRDFIVEALSEAMDMRHSDPNWIYSERIAVAIAANNFARAFDIDRHTTTEDVERIEVSCVGHVDYVSKLALRVAEWVVLENWRKVLDD